MKIALIAGLGIAALGFAGCSSTASLNSSASTTVTTAYNSICPAISTGAYDAVFVKMNAQVQTDYAAAKQICAIGAPTNAVVAGMDIIALQSVLAQYVKTK